MRKKTILFWKIKIARGYDPVASPFSEEDILDKLVEFSKKQGKNIKIYRHILRSEWRVNVKYKPLMVEGDYGVKDIPVPSGDRFWYLVIYYQ